MDVTRGLLPRPDDITFLDRNGVRITGCWLTVAGRRYAVADLIEVWAVRGPRHPLAYNAFKAAGVVAVAAGIAAPRLDTPIAWLGVAVSLAVPMAVALVALRVQPRPLALWADYRGRTERLLESADAVWFYQVCRALDRAREYRG